MNLWNTTEIIFAKFSIRRNVLHNLSHSSKCILTLVDACGKIKKHCKKICFPSSNNITGGPNPLVNLVRLGDNFRGIW